MFLSTEFVSATLSAVTRCNWPSKFRNLGYFWKRRIFSNEQNVWKMVSKETISFLKLVKHKNTCGIVNFSYLSQSFEFFTKTFLLDNCNFLDITFREEIHFDIFYRKEPYKAAFYTIAHCSFYYGYPKIDTKLTGYSSSSLIILKRGSDRDGRAQVRLGVRGKFPKNNFSTIRDQFNRIRKKFNN